MSPLAPGGMTACFSLATSDLNCFLHADVKEKERSIYLTRENQNGSVLIATAAPLLDRVGKGTRRSGVGSGAAFDREPVLPSNEASRLEIGPVMRYQI